MPRRAVAAREKDRIHWMLAHQDRAQLLSLIVRRIYTLRNQILHGVPSGRARPTVTS